MDWHQRLHALPTLASDELAVLAVAMGLYKRPNRCRGQVERHRIDVAEQRGCPSARDRSCRGEKSERTGNDGIAGSDVQRHEGEQQGIGPRGHPESEPALAVGGHRRLELAHGGPEDETLT